MRHEGKPNDHTLQMLQEYSNIVGTDEQLRTATPRVEGVSGEVEQELGTKGFLLLGREPYSLKPQGFNTKCQARAVM